MKTMTMSLYLIPLLFVMQVAHTLLAQGAYFPPAGEALANQDQRSPAAVGMSPHVVAELRTRIPSGRWALWRHGYLLHVEGDFNRTAEIASARKMVHTMILGASIAKGKVPSIHQKIAEWSPELRGADAEATWWHVITQTSAFDDPTRKPGDLWAYSDTNPVQLCRALARVWGKTDYADSYSEVAAAALLDEIGARGWSVKVRSDGVRFTMDLEDFGRLGLLLVNGGRWNGRQLIPQTFVHNLLTKQVVGVPVNYDNANDGHTGLRVEDFPDCPYGYFTWVNTGGDLWPGAARTWATALGAGGHYLAFDPSTGIVLAIQGGSFADIGDRRPGWPIAVRAAIEAVEANIAGPDPLCSAETYPIPDWQVAARPEELGFSGATVDAYKQWLQGRAGGRDFGTVVSRHGRIAFEHYGGGATQDSAWEIGSITKSAHSAMLGLAIEEGRMALDTTAYSIWPPIYTTTGMDKDKDITLFHMVTTSGGWKQDFLPGTKWAYNNAEFAATHQVIARTYELANDDISPMIEMMLGNPVRAKSWRAYHKNEERHLAIDSTMRDLNRYGYLWLRWGNWDGLQCFPASYARKATQNQVANLGKHYGFCWFVNDGQVLLPSAPADTFYHVGFGAGDRRTVLLVIPSLDLVATVSAHRSAYDIGNDYRSEPVATVNEWIGKILDAASKPARGLPLN